MRGRARALVEAGTAWILLAASCLLIAVAPFGVVRRLLGEARGGQGHGSPIPSTSDIDRAHRVALAIARSVRRSPWRTDCYPQALTARVLLRTLRVPHTVSFGLRRDAEGAMVAHAWVRAGGLQVTGGDAADFVEVGTFGWPTTVRGGASDDDIHLLRAHDQQHDPAS